MKRTKDLIMETLFSTEDEKKNFENYNRWMQVDDYYPMPDYDKKSEPINKEEKKEENGSI